MPTFYVLQGPDKGQKLHCPDSQIRLGRGSDQVPLTDPAVSRSHAEVTHESGAWMLRDLGSANGTYVNGARIHEIIRLKHGDQIRVGGTILAFAGSDSLQQVTGADITSDLVSLDEEAAFEPSVVRSVPRGRDEAPFEQAETLFALKSWNVMRALTEAIGSFLTPADLLPRVSDILFEELPIDRAIIFLRDEETGEFLPEVVRFATRRARADAHRDAVIAPRSIIDHVAKTHDGVLCASALDPQPFESGASMTGLGSKSVLCVPIAARDRVHGVVYLDVDTAKHTFVEPELKLAVMIGNQTGLAIENARLVQAAVERERLAAAGETTAYLSHSIKNILQGMRSGSDLVQRGLDKKDCDLTVQGWRILDRNLDRCYTLMLNMLAFSKTREPQTEMLQINAVVEDAVSLMRKRAEEAEIQIQTEYDRTTPPIPIDREGIYQAVLNLLVNALEEVPRGSGKIVVATDNMEDEMCVELRLRDNGPGIPAEQREHIFTAFHSTKGQSGTGLGLAVAKKTAQEHHGTLTVRDAEGGGAEFLLRLPTAEGWQPKPTDTARQD